MQINNGDPWQQKCAISLYWVLRSRDRQCECMISLDWEWYVHVEIPEECLQGNYMGKSKRFFTDKTKAAKDSDILACTFKSHFRTPKNILAKVGWPFFKFTWLQSVLASLKCLTTNMLFQSVIWPVGKHWNWQKVIKEKKRDKEHVFSLSDRQMGCGRVEKIQSSEWSCLP